MKHAHVIGAGLAGIAAAMALADRGVRVYIYDSAPVAGGRCRSYFDRELGCRVDNGNHLLLSGNRAAMAYLHAIGAADSLAGPGRAEFPFVDLKSGERWVLRPNEGLLPWWIFAPTRRVPGSRPTEYLALLRLRIATADATITDCVRPGPLWRRLLEPLAIAALNTMPDRASAALMQAVIAQSLGRGGGACIPCWPSVGMSESLIEPALRRLAMQHAQVHLSCRIGGLDVVDQRVVALHLPQGRRELEPGDQVVLATPAPVATQLLPGLTVPNEFEAIVNLHFAMPPTLRDTTPRFIGLIGGTAEWVFVKAGHLSVTISAANRLVDEDAQALAGKVWPDVSAALAIPATPMPAWRVVKERRATFAATPAQLRRRPGARTDLRNLVLAGDWTDTGLPATIEGAICSGRTAAETLMQLVP